MASFNDLCFCTKQESEQFTSANILKATVATNGYQGGDSGHGSRTYFSLEDLASTDMDISRSWQGGDYAWRRLRASDLHRFLALGSR